MEIEKPEASIGTLTNIAISTSLLKGFSVLYFLFLPILYSQGIINASFLGYIGAFLIGGILICASFLTYKPHLFNRTKLLYTSLSFLFFATILLFWKENIVLLSLAYLLIGLAVGIGVTIINELAAQFTSQNKRYGIFANIAMFGDILRIVYPLIVGLLYVTFGFIGLVIFTLINVVILITLLYLFSTRHNLSDEKTPVSDGLSNPLSFLKKNKSFTFVTVIEFLDSFASSQLFVFLPVLLIFKGFSIENALVFQSIVFLGYLSGRKIVSLLAKKLNGFNALAIAESGMIITIILLLLLPSSLFLYVLCFLLGIFTRGTSPVIKAMAFDQLEASHTRRGSAIHVVSGDSGSVLGQLLFGLLLAWFGVTAPFIGSAICAGLVVLACVAYPYKKPKPLV